MTSLSITKQTGVAPIKQYPSDDIFTQEPDYDTIMDDARSSIDDRHESISAPRENIFGSSLTSPRNACMHSRVSKPNKAKVESDKSRRMYVKESCIYVLPKRSRTRRYEKIENLEMRNEMQEVKTKQNNECVYTRSKDGNQSELAEADTDWQDQTYKNNKKENNTSNRRHSCSYERKGSG